MIYYLTDIKIKEVITMKLLDKFREINPKKKRRIIILAIILIIAIGIIVYCVSNPQEISNMTGGKLDGVVSWQGVLNMVLLIAYVILSYWAAGVVIYENKIVVHTFGSFFLQRLCYGLFLGVILIPIAIIKKLFSKW